MDHIVNVFAASTLSLIAHDIVGKLRIVPLAATAATLAVARAALATLSLDRSDKVIETRQAGSTIFQKTQARLWHVGHFQRLDCIGCDAQIDAHFSFRMVWGVTRCDTLFLLCEKIVRWRTARSIRLIHRVILSGWRSHGYYSTPSGPAFAI